MIASLSGRVAHIDDKIAILSVNGVGYAVFLTASALRALNVDENMTVYTYLYQREEGPELYGFLTMEEQRFFERLLTISGVGPKVALGVLAEGNLADVKRAIIHGDATILKNVAGIGPKTAERIIIELKNAADLIDDVGAQKSDAAVAAESSAIEALVQLGYSAPEARQALRGVSKKVQDPSQRVREALRVLGEQRSR